MANSTKRPIRATFSQAMGDGEYQNVPNIRTASGVHIHRNDATAKQFKAKVSSLQEKLANQGFVLQKQDDKYALFTRQMSQTIDELEASLDEAPF